MARKAEAGPNAGSRKAAARKAHKCQLCGTKVMPAKAKSVIVDPPGVGEVKIVKARENKSYWCGDCAKGKKVSYETAIERKKSNGGGKAKAKPKSKATKATAKASGGRKKATGRKTGGAKKGGRKRTSKAEPF